MKIAGARKPGLISKPGGPRTTLPPRNLRFEQAQGLGFESGEEVECVLL